MKLSPDQLASALRKNLLPCYLVTGDETLLVQRALDAIRAAARKRGFGSRELYVTGPGFDWGAPAASASSLSLFAEKRIVEIRVPTGKPGRDGSAAITELVGHCGDDVLLLFESAKLDKAAAASAWVRAIEQRGAVVRVWPVSARDLPAWIGEEMRAAGLEPDRDALRLLAERVEGNLLAADQEIQKLRLLLGPGAVTAADIAGAVADSSRYDVYLLVDAAVGGKGARSIRILGRLRSEGVEPVIILWALKRELRSLAGIAARMEAGGDLAAALREARVWPSRQALVRSCAGRRSAPELYRLLGIAERADAAAKGQSGEDFWHLAGQIVIGLAAPRARAA